MTNFLQDEQNHEYRFTIGRVKLKIKFDEPEGLRKRHLSHPKWRKRSDKVRIN